MRVAILGGGISGLSAAWYLLKREPGAEIVLFEAAERLGGWIESRDVDGFLFELGPRTFQKERCPELLTMVEELGLARIESEPEAKRRFLWRKGKLREMGTFWPQMVKAGLKDLVTGRGVGEESIYEFAKRRMGDEAAELFFDPITKGVFGGEMRKLSLEACFPALKEAERVERSLVKWMLKGKKSSGGLFTLKGGMGSLVEALGRLPMEIHLRKRAEEIRSDGVVVEGRFWPADLMVSALPGKECARLTKVPLQVREETINVVNFGFRSEVLPKKGYGYLVPSLERELLLGQIWDTCVFPVSGQTKVTSMTKGPRAVEVALDALKRHMNVVERPDAILSKEAQIPQYDVGHRGRIEMFEGEVGRRFGGKVKLVGNYLFNPSVEGCLSRAKFVSNNLY